MSPPAFRLLCLGTAALERTDGTPCDHRAQRPRQIALLAYLATSGQNGRARSDIVGLLWPHTRRQRAWGNLSTLEWEIREALGVDVIGHTGERRWFAASEITSDIHDFREAIRTARYADAVSVYGGSFLRGLSLREQPRAFASWVASEGRKLATQLRRALLGLATAGQWRPLVQYWERVETLGGEDLDPAVAYLEALVRAGEESHARDEHARLLGLLQGRRRKGAHALRDFGKTLASAPRATVPASVAPARDDAPDHSGHAPGTDLSAPDLHARGLESFRRFTPEAFAEAETWFRQAIDADPGFARAHASLGGIYIFRYIAVPDHRLLDQGIPHLDRALQLDPTLSEPYRWLTYAYSRTGDFKRASEMAFKSVAYDHEDAETRYFAGGAFHTRALMEPDPESMTFAVREYLQAVDMNPAFGWAWNGLAHLYMLHGDTAAAEDAISHALGAESVTGFPSDHAPRATGAGTMQGLLLLRKGQLEAAEETLRDASERYGSERHLWAPHFAILAEWALGRIHELGGDFAAALRQYRTARTLVFAHRERMGMGHHAVRAHLGLATVHVHQGERAQAEQQAAAAASLLEQGKGFDLNWVWGGSLAETHYEFARYHATARDSRATVESLAAAARWGWSDPEAVRSDPAFSRPAIAPHLETVLATMTRKPLPR